jgi:hypothetical protein
LKPAKRSDATHHGTTSTPAFSLWLLAFHRTLGANQSVRVHLEIREDKGRRSALLPSCVLPREASPASGRPIPAMPLCCRGHEKSVQHSKRRSGPSALAQRQFNYGAMHFTKVTQPIVVGSWLSIRVRCWSFVIGSRRIRFAGIIWRDCVGRRGSAVRGHTPGSSQRNTPRLLLGRVHLPIQSPNIGITWLIVLSLGAASRGFDTGPRQRHRGWASATENHNRLMKLESSAYPI